MGFVCVFCFLLFFNLFFVVSFPKQFSHVADGETGLQDKESAFLQLAALRRDSRISPRVVTRLHVSFSWL